MNREIFLWELQKQLRRLPVDEIENTIGFYEEYFNDAGPEREAEVIAELGSPAAVAAKVIGEYAVGNSPSVKSAGSKLWVVILAVCASPVALPVAIAVLAVVFAMIVSLFAVCFSLGVSALAVAVSGVVMFFAGFWALVIHPATGLFYIGSGLLAVSLGSMLGIGMVQLCRAGVAGIQKLLGRFLIKKSAI